ncbi:MAG: phosphonate ABC transporter, permease protein PhnE [Desulfobacteraceae bacterium]|nr:MAG: phosphonate ABC transporter, permease protein PhnE [Desulfobacteraceae bacterium]
MNKGLRFTTAGAGLMLIAGFVLPWLGKNPFQFSGLAFAGLGYPFLYAIPFAGGLSAFFALRTSRLRPSHILYPGLAGVLSLALLGALFVFSDTGSLRLDWPLSSMEFIRFEYKSNVILFHPFKDMGVGAMLSTLALLGLCVLPLVYTPSFEHIRETDPESYRQIIKDPRVGEEYRRFSLVGISLAILVVTYVWCGISPYKLWENRGNAKEYLFGRAMSEGDLAYINDQAQRAPEIEAQGLAEEYMSNKYRGIPFSQQPSSQDKARERKEMAAKMLAGMDEKEKTRLSKEARKSAIKEKKGGYFPPETSPVKIKGYLVALMETVAIAVWGTMLAVICAIPISFFAARNTLQLIFPSDDLKGQATRQSISFGVRRFLDSCRGFNEFVMALIFVAVIGLGPYAGILALWIHTFGILGKVFSEQIEAIESGQVEALTSTGAGSVQTIAFSVMPQVLPVFVSYTLLRFESNVRSAAILGFVGAGGIGFLIFDKLNGYLFREVCTMMIIIIITVGIIDHLCSRIRMRFI